MALNVLLASKWSQAWLFDQTRSAPRIYSDRAEFVSHEDPCISNSDEHGLALHQRQTEVTFEAYFSLERGDLGISRVPFRVHLDEFDSHHRAARAIPACTAFPFRGCGAISSSGGRTKTRAALRYAAWPAPSARTSASPNTARPDSTRP